MWGGASLGCSCQSCDQTGLCFCGYLLKCNKITLSTRILFSCVLKHPGTKPLSLWRRASPSLQGQSVAGGAWSQVQRPWLCRGMKYTVCLRFR